MLNKLTTFTRQYRAALQDHLARRGRSGLQQAQEVGRRAITRELKTLDLVRIHDQALVALLDQAGSQANRVGIVRRAATFFAAVATPIEEQHRTARQNDFRIEQLTQLLNLRTADLAASKQQLKMEAEQRRLTEASLQNSKQHYGKLLEQSRQMQEQLRLLSRQLLTAQEEERKKISRELHDVIAQTLTSINVRLATLRKTARLSTKGIERSIARTQELVERSVSIVHQFARELRPTALDDLGLIPALHSHLKNFRAETGIRVSLTASAAMAGVAGEKRTVLYRVAQEALTNAARHGQASQVDVKFEVRNGALSMTIKDNGKGFDRRQMVAASKRRRLGLIGMKERLEMVGGHLNLLSAPGKGTTVVARVPSDGQTLKIIEAAAS